MKLLYTTSLFLTAIVFTIICLDKVISSPLPKNHSDNASNNTHVDSPWSPVDSRPKDYLGVTLSHTTPIAFDEQEPLTINIVSNLSSQTTDDSQEIKIMTPKSIKEKLNQLMDDVNGDSPFSHVSELNKELLPKTNSPTLDPGKVFFVRSKRISQTPVSVIAGSSVNNMMKPQGKKHQSNLPFEMSNMDAENGLTKNKFHEIMPFPEEDIKGVSSITEIEEADVPTTFTTTLPTTKKKPQHGILSFDDGSLDVDTSIKEDSTTNQNFLTTNIVSEALTTTSQITENPTTTFYDTTEVPLTTTHTQKKIEHEILPLNQEFEKPEVTDLLREEVFTTTITPHTFHISNQNTKTITPISTKDGDTTDSTSEEPLTTMRDSNSYKKQHGIMPFETENEVHTITKNPTFITTTFYVTTEVPSTTTNTQKGHEFLPLNLELENPEVHNLLKEEAFTTTITPHTTISNQNTKTIMPISINDGGDTTATTSEESLTTMRDSNSHKKQHGIMPFETEIELPEETTFVTKRDTETTTSKPIKSTKKSQTSTNEVIKDTTVSPKILLTTEKSTNGQLTTTSLEVLTSTTILSNNKNEETTTQTIEPETTTKKKQQHVILPFSEENPKLDAIQKDITVESEDDDSTLTTVMTMTPKITFPTTTMTNEIRTENPSLTTTTIHNDLDLETTTSALKTTTSIPMTTTTNVDEEDVKTTTKQKTTTINDIPFTTDQITTTTNRINTSLGRHTTTDFSLDDLLTTYFPEKKQTVGAVEETTLITKRSTTKSVTEPSTPLLTKYSTAFSHEIPNTEKYDAKTETTTVQGEPSTLAIEDEELTTIRIYKHKPGHVIQALDELVTTGRTMTTQSEVLASTLETEPTNIKIYHHMPAHGIRLLDDDVQAATNVPAKSETTDLSTPLLTTVHTTIKVKDEILSNSFEYTPSLEEITSTPNELQNKPTKKRSIDITTEPESRDTVTMLDNEKKSISEDKGVETTLETPLQNTKKDEEEITTDKITTVVTSASTKMLISTTKPIWTTETMESSTKTNFSQEEENLSSNSIESQSVSTLASPHIEQLEIHGREPIFENTNTFIGVNDQNNLGNSHGSKGDDNLLEKEGEHEDLNICTTAECVHSASKMLSRMDFSVDPCDDFYEFSCGTFLKETHVPSEKSNVDIFSTISDKLQEQIQILLSQEIDEENDILPIKIIKNMYSACMNTDLIEERGEKPLLDLLHLLGGWPILVGDTWAGEHWAWTDTVARMKLLGLGIDYIIELSVMNDFSNSSTRIIYLDQGSTELDREFLLNGWNDTNVVAYFTYIKDIALVLGAEEEVADREAREIVNFEMKIGEISASKESRRELHQLYNPLSIKELQHRHPYINWLEYMNMILPQKSRVDENQTISLADQAYFKKLGPLIENTPKRVIANHLLWHAVDDSLDYLTDKLQRIELKYRSKTNGKNERDPLWKECVMSIAPRFKVAVGAKYVREYFREESKAVAVDMVNDIKEAFEEIIKTRDWMDEDTKKSALEKLHKMSVNIAYPNELMDDNIVTEYYKGLHVKKEEYFESSLRSAAFLTNKALDRLHESVNKTDWRDLSYVAIVNAFYHPLLNYIMFPAGILQEHFFSAERPKYMNYAAIGFVIGHEITHGFDDMGSQFDVEGNLRQWWLNETLESYTTRSQCIIDQYSNFTDPEVNITLNGINTQGENIADNGGVKEAYIAYRKWVERYGQEQGLPGLNYTSNQLFWVSAAQTWCTKYKPEALKYTIITDAHSPGRFRVLGPFLNSIDFANDFNCPSGSPMNPESKCEVW